MKTKSRMWVAVVMAVVLAGSCLAQKQVTDVAIADEVRVKLAADSIVKGGALAVDVKSGVVTLSGLVPTQTIKQRAGKLAKSVKGVKQVVNNITIQK